MKPDKEALRRSLRLYAITDRSWLAGRDFHEEVEKVLAAGATFLQIREKEASYDEFLAEAKALKKIAARYGVPFVVNDNIDIALACDADGVHVGQSDIVHRDVRALIGPDKILGISANTVESALKAQEMGADYLGVGAVFGTSTKKDATNADPARLKEIASAVSVPVAAIGGINETNVHKLKGTGIDGVCVISAIFAKPDMARATKDLLRLIEDVIK